MRKLVLITLATLAILAVPLIGLGLPAYGLPATGIVTVLYLALAPLLVAWQRQTKSWSRAAYGITTSATLLATLFALGAGALTNSMYLAIAAFGTAVLYIWLASMNKHVGLAYSAGAALYLGLAQVPSLVFLSGSADAPIFTLMGMAIFLIGYKLTTDNEAMGMSLRHVGLIGPYIGALLCLASDPTSQLAIVALAVGACLLGCEAYLQHSVMLYESAGALFLAAYSWLLVAQHVTQLHLFILPWAAYFWYLATRYKDKDIHRQAFLGLALLTLTLPLAAAATSGTGQLYSVELIFVGLTLAIIGSVIFNALAMWWGMSVAFIETLYLIPQYITSDSQVPLLSSAVGLVIVATAVLVHFSRQSDGDDDTEDVK